MKRSELLTFVDSLEEGDYFEAGWNNVGNQLQWVGQKTEEGGWVILEAFRDGKWSSREFSCTIQISAQRKMVEDRDDEAVAYFYKYD